MKFFKKIVKPHGDKNSNVASKMILPQCAEVDGGVHSDLNNSLIISEYPLVSGIGKYQISLFNEVVSSAFFKRPQ